MDDKRKSERRQPLSDAELLQLGMVLPHEHRETDRRNEQSTDCDSQVSDFDDKHADS